MSSPPIVPTRSLARRGSAALVALLAVATASATFFQGGLAVLAADVIESLDMSRARLGFAFAVFSLTGGVLSPMLGRFADRAVVRVLMALFLLAATGLLVAAAATSFAWIVFAAFLGGLALGAGNPVTNKLVLQGISTARRGLALGIKQAGPPLALFMAGIVLPPLAGVVGWRWALAIAASVPLAGLVATRFIVESPEAIEPGPSESERPPGSDQSAAGWLTAIGFAVAAGAGAIIGFLPLYSIEELGLSAAAAGWLAAIVGFTGIIARVAWGAAAPRFSHPIVPLTILAVASLAASLLILASNEVVGLIWLAAAATGSSMLGWHSVAWLALLSSVAASGVGRSTGLVQVGSSIGFATGPPLVGTIIDTTGSYTIAWTVVSAIFALALLLTLVWRRSSGAAV